MGGREGERAYRVGGGGCAVEVGDAVVDGERVPRDALGLESVPYPLPYRPAGPPPPPQRWTPSRPAPRRLGGAARPRRRPHQTRPRRRRSSWPRTPRRPWRGAGARHSGSGGVVGKWSGIAWLACATAHARYSRARDGKCQYLLVHL
jgi:hypothetical protein